MIPSSVRIFVCTEPQDMRRSFDALALAARERLGHDPRSGALFCFVNKRANRIKVLWWDENGFCLLYKRMHQAIVRLPPPGDNGPCVQVDGRQLRMLLTGIARPQNRSK
jgi:transposase